MQPSAASVELAAGLREALRLLETGDAKLAKTLVVVSDFQRTGTLNLKSVVVPKDVEVKVLPVGDLLTPNFAVTELNLQAGVDRPPHATVVSFSDEDRATVQTELWVDGKRMEAKAVTLNAGESANVELGLPPLGPGWHPVEFRIRASKQDALAADDARFQAVFVPEPVRVLSVEGRGGKRSFDAETFFVNTALDASSGPGTNAVSPFRLMRVAPSGLASALAPQRTSGGGGGEILPWDVVILPAPKADLAEISSSLERYVKAGGGLLLFAGEGLSPLRFNNQFVSLLPANLKSVETAGAETPWHIGELDLRSPYFSLFASQGGGDLSLGEFTHRYALDVLEGSQLVARFDDDAPFAVSRDVGRGRVLMINSTVDTTWNDWPKHKTFVPWLHRTVRHLAQRPAEEFFRAGAEVVTGTAVDVWTNGIAAAVNSVRWVKPDGSELVVKPGADRRWPEVEVSRPGIYRVLSAGGQELRRVAANVPPLESDLAAWRGREFEERIARSTEGVTTSLVGNLLGNERNQREFWRVLLLGALGLLIVETLWSNRTYV
jgi:hypothetical protein